MRSVSGTSGMVRQVNRDLVRDALKEGKAASVAALARATGLSVVTCTSLVQELVELGEAIELPSRSLGGRPARRYAYNMDYSLIAAIMLRTVGKSAEIRHSIINWTGRSIADGLEKCQVFSLEALDALLSRLVREYPNLKAAALSIPGVVNDGEIENCDIPQLSGVNLERYVAAKYGLKSISENNMNFAAMGYYSRNAADIPAGLAYAAFHLDHPPGMGIVLNGTLIKGKSAFAGEVGVIPYPIHKAKQEEKKQAREDLISHMAAVAVFAIAIINPSVLVFTGQLAAPDLHEPVRQRCLELIAERHLPQIVVRPEYEMDSFAGMTAMALNSLSGDLKLVETRRLWCEPDSMT